MSEPQASAEYLRFESGGLVFAFPLHQIREVVPADLLVRVPKVPPCILGLANHRGRILTVVDAVSQSTGRPPPSPRLLLLLDLPDRTLAVAAEQVEGIGPLEVHEVSGRRVARLGDRAVTILDAERFARGVDEAAGATEEISRRGERP